MFNLIKNKQIIGYVFLGLLFGGTCVRAVKVSNVIGGYKIGTKEAYNWAQNNLNVARARYQGAVAAQKKARADVANSQKAYNGNPSKANVAARNNALNRQDKADLEVQLASNNLQDANDFMNRASDGMVNANVSSKTLIPSDDLVSFSVKPTAIKAK